MKTGAWNYPKFGQDSQKRGLLSEKKSKDFSEIRIGEPKTGLPIRKQSQGIFHKSDRRAENWGSYPKPGAGVFSKFGQESRKQGFLSEISRKELSEIRTREPKTGLPIRNQPQGIIRNSDRRAENRASYPKTVARNYPKFGQESQKRGILSETKRRDFLEIRTREPKTGFLIRNRNMKASENRIREPETEALIRKEEHGISEKPKKMMLVNQENMYHV